MNPTEIKALKIMEALEREQAFSQRDLADQLGISLGLVNAIIKKLIRKGIFKVKTLPKSRVKYLLTPKGVAEKSVLTYRYILFSLNFYREIKNKFNSIIEKVAEEGKERILLFGSGELAEIASIAIKENNLQLVKIIDQTKQLDDLDFNIIIVLEIEKNDVIKEKLLEYGVPEKRILHL